MDLTITNDSIDLPPGGEVALREFENKLREQQ